MSPARKKNSKVEENLLEKMLRRRDEAKRLLAASEAKLTDLLITDKAAADAPYQKLLRRHRELKVRIHKHRLTLGRRRFGQRQYETKLEARKAAVVDAEQLDEGLQKQLEGLEAEIHLAKERLTREAGALGEQADQPPDVPR